MRKGTKVAVFLAVGLLLAAAQQEGGAGTVGPAGAGPEGAGAAAQQAGAAEAAAAKEAGKEAAVPAEGSGGAAQPAASGKDPDKPAEAQAAKPAGDAAGAGADAAKPAGDAAEPAKPAGDAAGAGADAAKPAGDVAEPAKPAGDAAGAGADAAKPAGDAAEPAKPAGDAAEVAKPVEAGTAAAKPAGDAAEVAKPVEAGADAAKPTADPAKPAGGAAAAAKPAGAPGAGQAASTAATAEEAAKADVGQVEEVDTKEQLIAAVEKESKVTPGGRPKKIVSKVVSREAPAVLENAGDISTTGACKDEVARHCRSKRPGANRVAECLRKHMNEIDMDDEDDRKEFSDACREELNQYLQESLSNVNRNVPLAVACKDDIEALCKDVDNASPGAVLACLRRERRKLSGDCKREVWKSLVAAAGNLRLDVMAFRACAEDSRRLCPGVLPRAGALQACLRNNTGGLSWECKAQLFRKQLEEDGDIRLSALLIKKCMKDKKKFCSDVEPGDSQIKDCLEDNMEEENFSKECAEELTKMMEQRSANFRMDSKIREYCAQDVVRICGTSLNLTEEVVSSEGPTQYDKDLFVAQQREHEDSIGKCLQDYRKEIRNPSCKDRVHRMIALSMQDIRFNHPLAQACSADRIRLCGDIPPGSARVIRCLKDKRDQLDQHCAAILFDQEMVMAENIDFHYPIKKACGREILRFCGAVPHGRGRVIRCLQKNSDDGKDFSVGCKEELVKFEERASEDYRLNSRLTDSCKNVIAEHCSQACGALSRKGDCGGTVLRCLTLIYEQIDEEECKAEVFYFMQMEVKDFKNDVFLAEACREDVDQLCSEHLKRGQGRVVQCLHDNRDRLSPACRSEEVQMDLVQSSSIELRPAVAKACEQERRTHCGDVRPGKSRVVDCLVAKADQVDFSVDCRNSLRSLQERRIMDWRLDYGLRNACKEDVDRQCVEELGGPGAEAAADGGVFRCLVSSAASETLTEDCSEALSRAASAELQFYRPGLPGSEACDNDARRFCGLGGPGGQAPLEVVGHVRACLNGRVAADRSWEANRTLVLPAIRTKAAAAAPGATSTSGPTGGRRLSQASSQGTSTTTSTSSATPTAIRVGPGMRMPAPKLTKACRQFMEVASPLDTMEGLETSLATAAVLGQLAGVESALGLPEGTLHNKGEAGVRVLTLTGWVAVVCMFGLVTAILGGVVYALRRWTGPGAKGYAMVLKSEHPPGGGEVALTGGR